MCVYPSERIHVGWTDCHWHRIWYTSADSSGNGHRLKTISPLIPQGGEGILEHIRASREYLLDPRVDLLDPRYRTNASHHPSTMRHVVRGRNFLMVVPFLDFFSNKHLMPIFFTLYYAVVPSCLK